MTKVATRVGSGAEIYTMTVGMPPSFRREALFTKTGMPVKHVSYIDQNDTVVRGGPRGSQWMGEMTLCFVGTLKQRPFEGDIE